jgi:hypothetical protein
MNNKKLAPEIYIYIYIYIFFSSIPILWPKKSCAVHGRRRLQLLNREPLSDKIMMCDRNFDQK